MQEKKIDINGMPFSYRISGEGPAVVLLHGFAEDASVWDNQLHALPGYQLILPNLPGSGGSAWTANVSMEASAELLQQFLQQLQIDRCILIGHSMGGYITLAFAELYPGRLDGFGLFHSSAFADTEEKKETRRKGIAFMRQHGGFEFVKAGIPNLYSPVSKKQQPGLLSSQEAASHGFTAEALTAYYEAMIARPDRTEILRRAKVPVLFVLGTYDNAVPLKDGLAQCHLPNLSHVYILENSGHMGMREEPQQANSALLDYLRSVRKGH